MIKYIIPVSLVVAWELSARYFELFFFPPASVAVVELYNQLINGPIINDTIVSFKRLAITAVITIPSVILLSLYIGYSSTANKLTAVMVNIARSMPSSALLPVVILISGLTYKTSIILLSYSLAVPLLVAAVDAVTDTVKTYTPLIKNLELSTFDAFRKVLIPGSMPGILIGVDAGLSIAFKFLFVVEIFSNSGIGYRINHSADHMAYTTSFALVIWIAIIGMIFFSLLRYFKKRLVEHWV